MRIEPYLLFNGRCEEALAFYNRTIGASTTMLMRFDESPEPSSMHLPPNWGRKVMHSSVQVGYTRFMASDGMGHEPIKFTGFNLSITADDAAHAKRLFDALSDDGQVFMPLGKTFWSECFGMLTDKFGVTWMIGVDQA
jgi:PhnB protein